MVKRTDTKSMKKLLINCWWRKDKNITDEKMRNEMDLACDQYTKSHFLWSRCFLFLSSRQLVIDLNWFDYTNEKIYQALAKLHNYYLG